MSNSSVTSDLHFTDKDLVRISFTGIKYKILDLLSKLFTSSHFYFFIVVEVETQE